MAFDPITGGYGAPTTHTVSTGVKKAKVPKVKGTVKRNIRRGKPKTAKPKPPPTPKAPTDKQLIDAAIRLRFGGEEQGYNQQLAQNQRFTSGVPAWYQNAIAEINGLKAQGQQSAQGTLGIIQGYNSTPILPGATDQQAAQARNNLNQQYAAKVANDAQGNANFMDRIAAAQGIAQGNTLNAANAERMGIQAGLTGLQGRKGDFATSYGAELESGRAKAEQDALKTQLAAQALGIKLDTLNKVQIPLARSLQKNRTAGQKVARTNARTQRGSAQTRAESEHRQAQQQEVKNAQWANDQALKAWKLAHPDGKKKGTFTPTQLRAGKQKYRRLGSYFDSATIKKDPTRVLRALKAPKSKDNPAGGTDPLLAKVYVDTVAYGGTDKATAKKFKKAYGWSPPVKRDVYETIGHGVETLVNIVGK